MSTHSKIDAYITSLPDDRRSEYTKVRNVIVDNLPDGFVEMFDFGMLCYVVPLEIFPVTYNKRPLMYAALANQKNYLSLYLMSVYGDKTRAQTLENAFDKKGKRLDMGKSCVRFKTADELPLEAIGGLIGGCSVQQFIAQYEQSRLLRRR